MKEHEKTTLHLQKYTADVGQSYCIVFILPLFLYIFQVHAYLKPSFVETLFSSFGSFLGGSMMNAFIVLEMKALKSRLNFSHTHTHTCTHTQSFGTGMHNILTHSIVSVLCMSEKKKEQN